MEIIISADKEDHFPFFFFTFYLFFFLLFLSPSSPPLPNSPPLSFRMLYISTVWLHVGGGGRGSGINSWFEFQNIEIQSRAHSAVVAIWLTENGVMKSETAGGYSINVIQLYPPNSVLIIEISRRRSSQLSWLYILLLKAIVQRLSIERRYKPSEGE
ncbi:hypothetical protein P167DRAFT_152307 [Morchella conica CCBAS932]|uniref:Uncharacterized protein n=1 Tax=Morchella conica CCBAS932 TaxID=1392247 RepID=A0A3N4KQ32_9PEZI|nr:hypothetical protein P167DRAFT_152307 [Morchella conica CCBAS932]